MALLREPAPAAPQEAGTSKLLNILGEAFPKPYKFEFRPGRNTFKLRQSKKAKELLIKIGKLKQLRSSLFKIHKFTSADFDNELTLTQYKAALKKVRYYKVIKSIKRFKYVYRQKTLFLEMQHILDVKFYYKLSQSFNSVRN